ncbi:thio:disulfide interchange protein, putative [Rubellimicrobium mesophilum DSM 19309]|uniref:Thio:disulfide interchange protein, putative n=1 Tax=Rubellimicrobium mesophilum DSM 19309 TaxID=442562 RepID=A0A017HKB9_9RHOB|nr:protein-disulfide reductase DsbD domain-containing protein [Rubellimicrobium mesophilum]EYD74578.1 thio:disulfide interchange protein, putative [Rubellimicrobium mesophilum DSM 19309]
MRHLLPLPALLLLGSALPVAAEAPPPEVARIEVLPGWRTEAGHHMAAIRLTLAPGWKTYWRAPGAAGLVPILDFSGSTGVASAEPRWPVPSVFEFNGLRSIGYEDAVTIPIDLALTGGPARLAGEVEIGVCNEICMPVRLSFSADLPEEGRRDPAIAAALVDQPMTGQEADAHATCAVAPDSDGVALTVHLAMPPLGPDEAVVIESGDPDLWVSEPASKRTGDTLVATAKAQSRDGGPLALDRSDLRITVLGEGKAVDIHGCQAG